LDQYGGRAQRYSVSPKFDQTFLVNTAPVRKRTDLYMVYYRVSSEVIRATIREESLPTRRRSIEDPAWTPDGAESLSALVTPARFRLLGRLFDPSPKFTGGRGSEFQ
jgi:hypothetical protein